MQATRLEVKAQNNSRGLQYQDKSLTEKVTEVS